MAGSNIVKMTPLDLFKQGGGSAEVSPPEYSVNVMEYGAWAEGSLYRNEAADGTITYDDTPNEARRAATGTAHHDDTAGIQAAINDVAKRGGGVVFFPYPGDIRRFYRIDGDPLEYFDQSTGKGTNEATHGDNTPNWQLRAQLYIPPCDSTTTPANSSNVFLLGEMPPDSLAPYHVPEAPFGFRTNGFNCRSVVLRSSRDVPDAVAYEDRPWAVIAAPEGPAPQSGSEMRTKSSLEMCGMKNLTVQAHLEYAGDAPRLYPTMGAVNLMNVRRMHIEDCFFGLDNEIGSNYSSGRCLQHSPTSTVGLFGAFEDCAEHKLEHVTVQGFKFGLVLPEMVNANFIHISNCEYGLCFLDSTHLTVIEQLSTHNNRRCICALPIPGPVWENGQTKYPRIFGAEIAYPEWKAGSDRADITYKPQVNLCILAHDYEVGHTTKPFVSQMRWGIWDPQNRLHGTVAYHQGFPGDVNSTLLKLEAGKDWSTEVELDLYNGSSRISWAPDEYASIDTAADRAAKNFKSDHCYYDHRAGGENGTLFEDDEDVSDWANGDWAVQPYDFIDSAEGRNNAVIPGCRFFRVASPRPSINGVPYAPPGYGSYYPILGASHMLALPLADLKSAWDRKYEKPVTGIPATDLAQAVQTALSAIPGKASAADLRYRIAEAESVQTGWEVPDDLFPIGFTFMGTAYSIPLSSKGDVSLRSSIGNQLYLTCLADGASVDVAIFDDNGVFILESLDVEGTLTFNNTQPVVGTTSLDPVYAYTVADRTVNLVTATTETSIDIELPAAVTVDGVRYARDFFLDIDNSANASDLALEFTGLGVDYAFVPLEDDSISEMMTIGAGERVRLYFTETPYTATGSLPVLNVARVTLGDFVTSTATQGGN